MDAYSSYIMTISNARTSELRREAAEYAMSAGARRRRRAAAWQRVSGWRLGYLLRRTARRRETDVAPATLPGNAGALSTAGAETTATASKPQRVLAASTARRDS